MQMALSFYPKEQEMKNLLTRNKQFYRTFAVLCITLMLEQAVILSVNLADNIMLGTYSEHSLAGVAAVNQIQFVLQQVVYAVSNGMIILGSQYWGQKRPAEIRKLSSIAMRISLILVTALFIAVSFFPRETLSIFTPDEAIISEGVKYLGIIRFSYFFFGVSAILLGTMRVAESVKIALTVSVISLILNCSINYVLIYGRFGAPEMGVRGAAIGTLIARIVECLIYIVYVFTHDKRIELRPKDLLHIDNLMLRDFIRVSTPVLLTQTLWGVSNALQTVILGHMNDVAIAAQSISSNIFLLLKVASVGACTAASIIIGKTIGEDKDMTRLKEYTRTLQVMFVCIGLVLGTALFFIRIPLLRIYNISDETRALANAYMLIQSVVLVTMSYQMPTNGGIIRGGGDTKFIMIVDLISIWGIVLPLSFLAAFVWNLSPIIVIMLLNSDQVFKCIPAFIRVNSYKWVRKLTRD